MEIQTKSGQKRTFNTLLSEVEDADTTPRSSKELEEIKNIYIFQQLANRTKNAYVLQFESFAILFAIPT